MATWFWAALGLFASCIALCACENPPHIIFIVADDLGWNDVGWHNPDINTTFLDGLAAEGVILNSSYTNPLCSPTRGAFLTGYYPYHLGLQGGVISVNKEQYLPVWDNITTLPQKLHDVGYATHMAGKWHLGFCNLQYVPTRRGFDSFYGIYSGSGDHYSHISSGYYDFRANETVDYEANGTYSTTAYANRAVEIINNHDPTAQPLFLYLPFQAPHSPMQVDQKYKDMYPNIANNARRTFSGMVTAMDDAVRQIVTALDDRGYMDNLLLVFMSDNGGTVNHGNNLPLRGAKNTLWEGGTRTPAFVYSKTLLESTGYTHHGLFHAVDWYTTLLDVAGTTPDDNVDGVSQWNMLKKGEASNRTEFVYNINTDKGVHAIRVGSYKLIEGNAGSDDDWFPVPTSKRRRRRRNTGGRYKRARLFSLYNIDDDPTETTDLSNSEKRTRRLLKERLDQLKASEVPANLVEDVHPDADPTKHNNVWSPGWC